MTGAPARRTAGEMCVYCAENTEDHRNPFGYLNTAVYACQTHTDAEILRAWCEQRLQDVGP